MLTYLQSPTIKRILEVTSPAFKGDELIPMKYTCDGQNEPPELNIRWLPLETKSLSIIVDDPDAPIGAWVHWIAWNIHPENNIKSNKIRGRQGLNDFGLRKYCGPCPPNGTHHYHFKVYALDSFLLDLNSNTTKFELEKAMKKHIVAYGELIGLYKRK
jgi:Raf kinase inhibitor-like YbhB/YbcL family protein